MRTFIVLGHAQKADPPVPLDDPTGAGRWDVLTRSVASAFLLSNGIRHDTEVYLVLLRADPPKTLWLRADEIRNLNPDDRSIQGLLAKALGLDPVAAHPMQSSPGVHLARWGLSQVLERVAQQGPIVLLHEMGPLLEDAAQAQRLGNAAFVLSDHEEFSAHELSAIRARSQAIHSLGPLSLHTSSCIAIIHNWLDRAEAARGR